MLPGPEDTTGSLERTSPSQSDMPCVRIIAGESEGEVITLKAGETIFGRSSNCNLSLSIAGLSREHAKFVRQPGLPVRVLDLDSTHGLFVNGSRVKEAVLAEGDLIGLDGMPVFQFRYHAFQDIEKARRLYERSGGDPISGAFNRRHLLDRVVEELALCRRQNYSCCILALAPDDFENPFPNQEQTQSLLRALAERLEGGLPTEDTLARWDNQIFVALLRGKYLSEAYQFAQKLNKLVALNPFPATAQRPRPCQLTLSVGVVEYRQDANAEEFVGRALKALNKARQKGNCVVRRQK